VVACDPGLVDINDGEAIATTTSENGIAGADSYRSLDPHDLDESLDLVISIAPNFISEIDRDDVVLDAVQPASPIGPPGAVKSLNPVDGVSRSV